MPLSSLAIAALLALSPSAGWTTVESLLQRSGHSQVSGSVVLIVVDTVKAQGAIIPSREIVDQPLNKNSFFVELSSDPDSPCAVIPVCWVGLLVAPFHHALVFVEKTIPGFFVESLYPVIARARELSCAEFTMNRPPSKNGAPEPHRLNATITATKPVTAVRRNWSDKGPVKNFEARRNGELFPHKKTLLTSHSHSRVRSCASFV